MKSTNIHFVENCDQIELNCPLVYEEMEKLHTSFEDRERICGQCNKHVYHCNSENEVKQRLDKGECVSFFIKKRQARMMGFVAPRLQRLHA